MPQYACESHYTEQAAAKRPLVRMFKEESGAANSTRADSKGNWSVCSPETVGVFSAALYFFGRDPHRELGIPVGLINSSASRRIFIRRTNKTSGIDGRCGQRAMFIAKKSLPAGASTRFPWLSRK